jgi:hypothetical protein
MPIRTTAALKTALVWLAAVDKRGAVFRPDVGTVVVLIEVI